MKIAINFVDICSKTTLLFNFDTGFVSCYIFSIEFTPYKAQQPQQGIELQGKEAQKD